MVMVGVFGGSNHRTEEMGQEPQGKFGSTAQPGVLVGSSSQRDEEKVPEQRFGQSASS